MVDVVDRFAGLTVLVVGEVAAVNVPDDWVVVDGVVGPLDGADGGQVAATARTSHLFRTQLRKRPG